MSSPKNVFFRGEIKGEEQSGNAAWWESTAERRQITRGRIDNDQFVRKYEGVDVKQGISRAGQATKAYT